MKVKKSTRKTKAKPKPRKRIKPKTFTIEDIRSWDPCYDPARHLPKNWQGTVLDILNHKKIPFHDKLWVVCREELLSEKLMRLFAVHCARSVQHHLLTDERSIKAIDVAEKFALGEATKRELEVAFWAAAWAVRAARGAASKAAREVAYEAANRAAARAARGAASGANKKGIQLIQQKKLREMIIEGLKTGDTK